MSDVTRGLRHTESGATLVQTVSDNQPMPPVPDGWVETSASEAMGVLDANSDALRLDYETTHAAALEEQARRRAEAETERHAAAQRIADQLGVAADDVELLLAGRP